MMIELESILKSTFSPEQRRQIAIDPHIEIKTTSTRIDHSGRRNKLFLFTALLKLIFKTLSLARRTNPYPSRRYCQGCNVANALWHGGRGRLKQSETLKHAKGL